MTVKFHDGYVETLERPPDLKSCKATSLNRVQTSISSTYTTFSHGHPPGDLRSPDPCQQRRLLTEILFGFMIDWHIGRDGRARK